MSDRELWKLEMDWGMCVCVSLGAGENDQGASDVTVLSGRAPVPSHAPPLSSTSSKLSCLLSHWYPSMLTLATLLLL